MFTELDGLRKGYGSKGATVYRNVTDLNETHILFYWEDGKSYQDYLNRPDVMKALADIGTLEVFEVGETFFVEE